MNYYGTLPNGQIFSTESSISTEKLFKDRIPARPSVDRISLYSQRWRNSWQPLILPSIYPTVLSSSKVHPSLQPLYRLSDRNRRIKEMVRILNAQLEENPVDHPLAPTFESKKLTSSYLTRSRLIKFSGSALRFDGNTQLSQTPSHSPVRPPPLGIVSLTTETVLSAIYLNSGQF